MNPFQTVPEKAKLEKSIRDFLKKAHKPLIVILGPTGSGKTALSLQLAKKFHGEIVNADSRQIYDQMDIGTNKILPAEMQKVPHHLLSFKKPNEIFTVSEYKKQAVTTIQDILARKKIPFLVGGTGLYVSAVCLNYDIPDIPPDYALRAQWEKEIKIKGAAFLHQKLRKLDPAEAKKIHPNQTRYLMRALEIALSGRKKSVTATKKKPLFDCFFIGLEIPREELYQRLDERVEKMFQAGLLQEVEQLIKEGYGEKAHAMNGIGYREVLQYLKGEISLEKAKELIKQHTRHFAKRQMTWFRRLSEVQWIQAK